MVTITHCEGWKHWNTVEAYQPIKFHVAGSLDILGRFFYLPKGWKLDRPFSLSD